MGAGIVLSQSNLQNNREIGEMVWRFIGVELIKNPGQIKLLSNLLSRITCRKDFYLHGDGVMFVAVLICRLARCSLN